jgi:RNA polymerase sigma-70 factor, ECF subfamily
MDERRRRFEAKALPHLDAAYNLARWLTRSSADADDIVQEAMMRAYRGFDGFRGGEMKPWLLAIVRNCFLSTKTHTRQISIVRLTEDGAAAGESEVADEAPDPEHVAMRTDHSRKLNHVIETLPQEFREVLVLREIEDLSYRDIAEVTSVPIGTVMSRLARARALLKERWFSDVEGVRHGVQ